MSVTNHPHGGGSPQALSRWRPKVLEHIDTHAADTVAALQNMIRYPSVSGSDEENGIQDKIATQLDELGLDVDHWQIPLAETLSAVDFPGVEVDRSEAWGLVGALPGRAEGPSLMLNVHVDVVPPGDLDAWRGGAPFGGDADREFVHGRGACDMKGGVVAALAAVRALVALDVPLRGSVLLASVQGEEDGGLGTYAMLARGWRADACIIPEPTSLDIVPANGGSLTFRMKVHGLACHSSRRLSGVSAVEKFWPVFQALRRLEALRNASPPPLMGRWEIPYPIEIGMVRAGDWSSSVPDLLVAEGRYGVALDEPVALARQHLEQAVAQACSDDPWLRDHPVDLEWWGGQFASGQTSADAPIIAGLRRAHALTSSHEQGTWGAPYGSDLRLMTGIGGVPTVHYGPGDAALAHGPGERVPIAEVLTTARTLALLALDHCGVN